MLKVIGNILWLLLAGIWLAVGYALAGLVSFVLVVTIPFAFASWRLAGYALWPFGRVVVRKPSAGLGSLVGNVLWLLLSGVWLALAHVAFGLLLCITIIGIPMGLASFKMAVLALAPLGKQVVNRRDVTAPELIVV